MSALCRQGQHLINRLLCRQTATAPRIKLCHQSMQIRFTRNTSVTLYLYISQRNMPARFVPTGMSTNAAFITNATSTYKYAHFQQLINGQLFRFHISLLRCRIFLSNYRALVTKTQISAKIANYIVTLMATWAERCMYCLDHVSLATDSRVS